MRDYEIIWTNLCNEVGLSVFEKCILKIEELREKYGRNMYVGATSYPERCMKFGKQYKKMFVLYEHESLYEIGELKSKIYECLKLKNKHCCSSGLLDTKNYLYVMFR